MSLTSSPREMSERDIRNTIIGLMLAFLTAMLSTTIVINALPRITQELKGTQTDFSWIVTAALLATAASTPIWGKLADQFNKKKLIMISLLVFVLGSVLSGFATATWHVMAGRAIQGLALGGLMSLSQAVIGTLVSPRERGKYAGYFGATMAVAMSTGPLLGGAIVDSALGWRWTFFVCVPCAILALIVLSKTLTMVHIPRKVRIDWWGSLTLTSGVCALLIWVSFAGVPGYFDWLSWQSAVMVGSGVALLLLFIFIETRASEPILPLPILTNRTTVLAVSASIGVGMVMFSANVFMSQYFQLSRSHSPTEAGILMLPLIGGNVLGTVSSGSLITRYGRWKVFLVVGASSLTSGCAVASTFTQGSPMPVVAVALFMIGLGIGMCLQNLVLAVQNTVNVDNVGAASGAVTFFRSFGGAVSVAVLGSVLAARVRAWMQEGLGPTALREGKQVLDFDAMDETVRNLAREAYGQATGGIFLWATLFSACALIAVLFMPETKLRTSISVETASIPVINEAETRLEPLGEHATDNEVTHTSGSR